MFVPVWDENPLRAIRFQFVTVALIAINIAVFMIQAAGMPEAVMAGLGIVPRELFGAGAAGSVAGGAVAIPERVTVISYMFLHGDLLHLASNMVFLWVFGDNIEDALGHWRFLAFYLLCGIAAGLTHAFVYPTSNIPLIGASGAVAGVVAAYIILHPKVNVWVLVFRIIPLKLSATIVLGLWIITQVVMILAPLVTRPEVEAVAWWAHVGGLVAGAILVLVMRKPGVPLFDRGLRRTV